MFVMDCTEKISSKQMIIVALITFTQIQMRESQDEVIIIPIKS